MTTKEIEAGDEFFVLNRHTNVIDRRKVAAVDHTNGNVLLERHYEMTPMVDLYESEKDAGAALIVRAEKDVEKAEKELANAKIRAAKMRKKYGFRL